MNRLEPAWLDAQYNNRARVPEHAAIFERWGLASAQARERSACRIDMPYGAGPNETLDLFPAERSNAPVMVFIHGGWWRSLDKRDHSFIAPPFTQAGAMVVVPNYSLCPAVTIEAITLQMVNALAWVYRHAARHGGDPARIVIVGHSAGGHLVAMLLSCRWTEVASDLPARVVKSALSISGVFDLEPLRHTPFLRSDLRLTTASAGRLSPARFPPPKGRLFAVVGGDESKEHLRQNRLIRDAWGEQGVPVCETLPGRHHFDVVDALTEPSARLHRLTLRLLGLPQTRAP